MARTASERFFDERNRQVKEAKNTGFPYNYVYNENRRSSSYFDRENERIREERLEAIGKRLFG